MPEVECYIERCKKRVRVTGDGSALSATHNGTKVFFCGQHHLKEHQDLSLVMEKVNHTSPKEKA